MKHGNMDGKFPFHCTVLTVHNCLTRWWFQILFIFTPIWGRFPFWLIFFKGVETTNELTIYGMTLSRCANPQGFIPKGPGHIAGNFQDRAWRRGSGVCWRTSCPSLHRPKTTSCWKIKSRWRRRRSKKSIFPCPKIWGNNSHLDKVSLNCAEIMGSETKLLASMSSMVNNQATLLLCPNRIYGWHFFYHVYLHHGCHLGEKL